MLLFVSGNYDTQFTSLKTKTPQLRKKSIRCERAVMVIHTTWETETKRLVASLGYRARACLKFKGKKLAAWLNVYQLLRGRQSKARGGPTSPPLLAG